MYKKQIAQWTLGSFGLAALLGLTIDRFIPITVSPTLVAEREAMHRARIPVFLPELARPLPSPSENAATIYAAMPAPDYGNPQSRAEDELQARLIKGADKFNAGDWQAVRKTVADAAPRLRAIHEAVRRPYCVFDHDYRSPHPGDIPLPELAKIRKAARLLSLESLLMAHDGHAADAVANARRGFRLGDHASHDPVLIGYLVALNVDAITTKTMQSILRLAPNDAAASRAVLAAMKQDARMHSLKPAIGGELAFEQTFCESMRREGATGLQEMSAAGGGHLSPSSVRTLSAGITLGQRYWNYTLDANALTMLRINRATLAVCDLPYSQAEPIVARAEAQIPTHSTPESFLVAMILPQESRTLYHRAVLSNQESVTKAAAAALTYRAAHGGALPARLDQAMPTPPRNAFDDSPLAYQVQGSDFTLSARDPSDRENKSLVATFSSR